MSSNTLLEIFLFLQVFIIGVLAAIGWRYGDAHFRGTKSEVVDKDLPPAEYHMPEAVKQRLLEAAENQFQASVNKSAIQLQGELDGTGKQVNSLLLRLATEIVNGELEHYRRELIDLQKHAEADMGGIRTEVTKHQAELKARLAQEMGAEKLRLIKQIDTKLADAVASFLTETLQNNVDLGSQSAYLVAMLDEHKADFVREVADEAETTG